jgi:acyl-CoA reductase-like NAD-dependent aldehyde dehydrogenase
VSRVAEFYIAGTHTTGATTESIAVHSPVTGEHIADLPLAGRAEIDAAVSATRKAFLEYAEWSTHERAELCHRVAAGIEARVDELARLTTDEQGKPLAEARGDVEDSAALFADAGEDVKRLYGHTIPSAERGKRMLTHRRPVGV